VIEIDGASNRGIDEIRVLRENVKFAPTHGRYKMYIIDEVHMLTTEAFNALLKTLEEPPEFVKFIFATTQPNKVIPTILSRCQRFDFKRIPTTDIASQLERIAAQEKIDIDKEVFLAIAKGSDGSLRDAESVLDQLASFSRKKISLQDVIAVLGLIEQEVLFEITDKIIQKDAKAVLAILNRIIDEGKDTAVFLNSLIEHFRNLMVAKVAGTDLKLIDLPQDLCERLLKQSNALTLEDILGAFNILSDTQEMSKRFESLRIPLEINLVRLAHGKEDTRHQTKVRPEKNEVMPNSAKEPVKHSLELKHLPPKKEADPPAKIIPLEDIKTAWMAIIDKLAKVKMSAATYLSEGSLIKIHGSVLTVAFAKNHSLHKESLEKKENRELLERILAEHFKIDLKVNFILSHEVSSTENSDDPLIKSAMETFGGRIVNED
ncbi:MAG: DNA polymerase III subunit gamma/tau, partial [Candidatus Omnitrophica bacterium]|nr:DNA polymerase III subunit gamma/tau [Candidatus Omnitrophota bacterium]